MSHPTTAPVRRGWYHGWNIVAVCVLSQVASLGVTLNCFSLYLPAWKHEFGVPISVLTLATAIFSAGCSVVAPMVGVVLERMSARWVFGLALLGLAAIHTAVGFATEAWQVILLYAIPLPFAIGFGATIPAQAVVSRWFVRRAGFAMGLTAFGLATAGVVLPLIVVRLMPYVGWRGVWWLYAGVIALIILPVVVGVMRDRPTLEQGRDYVGATPTDFQGERLRFREIFASRNFWVTIGVFAPCIICSQGVGINLAPLVESHGFNIGIAGGLVSAFSVAALLAKLAVGVLADRFGNKTPLVLTPLLTAVAAAVLALGAGQLPLLFAGMILLGVTGGAWTLLASATAAEFGPRGFGRAYGVISAFTPIGSVLAPVVARSQELTGSYDGALWVLAALGVGGAGIGLLWKNRPPQFRPAGAPAAQAA